MDKTLIRMDKTLIGMIQTLIRKPLPSRDFSVDASLQWTLLLTLNGHFAYKKPFNSRQSKTDLEKC